MTAIPVQIIMDDEDFSYLCSNSTKWAATMDGTPKRPDFGWIHQVRDGRFEIQGSPGTLPGLHWKIAYWVGTDYTTVILAKSFLAARGFGCEVVWDLAEPGEWTILTDYDHDWQETAAGAQKG